VARLGGDEFLLVLALPADPAARLRQLHHDVAGPCPVGDHPRLGVTFGAAVTAGDTGWQQVVARCDIALYRAKTTGAGVALYDPAVDPPPVPVPDPRPQLRRRDRSTLTHRPLRRH
jgi:GGDEF domain-containing protein